MQPLTKQFSWCHARRICLIPISIRYNTAFLCPSDRCMYFVLYMHAVSKLSWSTDFLAFASRQLAPKIVDLSSFAFCSIFFLVSERSGRRKPPAERSALYTYINVLFSPSAFFSLPAAGLSSCSRLRGTQGARPGPARKFGPWPRSVARALGVQSRKSAWGGIPST